MVQYVEKYSQVVSRILASLIALSIFVIGNLEAQQNVPAPQHELWVEYTGADGPGKGKTIVLVSGDEEYRSEEALPMLGQILAKKYGFTCIVLFAIDARTGEINALDQTNIPGLENLRRADLMLISTRFRELPDSQMKYIDEYIQSGKPVIGLRTATHAFRYRRNKNSPFAKYDFKSEVKGWEDGFGRRVLGETWVDHHGVHGEEGTRALVDGIRQMEKHPILNGVHDIWGGTDVYTVRALPENCEVLLYGLSTSGMTPQSPVNFDKSVMPVAWTRTYTSDSGRRGRVFATTMGASIDFLSEDLRRMIVNACFWTLGMEDKIPEKADVAIIGAYHPTMFSTDLFKKGTFPSKYRLE